MPTHPSRVSPVVDAFTTLASRWLSQDAARVNAAQAAIRLHHQRRELEDVTRFLAAQHRRAPGGEPGAGQSSSAPP